MTNTATNVRVGATGTIYKAPLGTTLPASLNAATTSFTELGYVGEDGVAESQPVDTEAIKAWQLGATVRTLQTSHDLTYKFTLLETSNAVQAFVYGTYPLTGTPMEITGAVPTHHAMIIDVVDATYKRRICIPDGCITELGDVIYANAEAQAYECTVTCYPDSSGHKAFVYTGVAP